MFRQRTTRKVLLGQHQAINSALQARDPDAARKAVEVHMDYVAQCLTDQEKADKNEAIARQKLDHEASIAPQLGVPGGTPNPKKLRLDSAMIVPARLKVA